MIQKTCIFEKKVEFPGQVEAADSPHCAVGGMRGLLEIPLNKFLS
jgi:hypothetical protein